MLECFALRFKIKKIDKTETNTCTWWAKQPVVSLVIPIVLIALLTKFSGDGANKDGRDFCNIWKPNSKISKDF